MLRARKATLRSAERNSVAGVTEMRGGRSPLISYLFTIAVTFILFGPKLGVVDLSIVASATTAVLVTASRGARLPRQLVSLGFLVLTIFVYSWLIALAMDAVDLYGPLRASRALVASVLIGLSLYNARMDTMSLYRAVLNALAINAIAVFLEFLFPSLKPVITPLVGFDKHFVPMRSFGLTAGYDTSGYLNAMGFYLSFRLWWWGGYRVQDLARSIVFFGATFLTSRSSMALVLSLGAISLLEIILRGRKRARWVGVAILGGAAFVGLVHARSLISATVVVRDARAIEEITYVGSFAVTNLVDWWESAWFAPNDPLALLFGAGLNPASDVGYVKLLFLVGIVGSLLTIVPYGMMLSRAWRWCNLSSKRQYLSGANSLALFASALRFVILLHPIINVKNLYFLTRGYWELTVILFTLFLRASRDARAVHKTRDGDKMSPGSSLGMVEVQKLMS